MRRSHSTRSLIAACAIAAAAALVPVAAASPAVADPAPPADLGAALSFIPGLISAAQNPAGTAPADIAASLRGALAAAPLPPEAKAVVESILTFIDGSGGGGPEIPVGGPVLSQFLYPTIAPGCISATGNSVAAAVAVGGPAPLPPPGPGVGQVGFVFTALGTGALAPQQAAPLTVNWVNLDTLRTGSAVLDGSAGINPQGPATLTTIADTGRGRVLAALGGSVSTAAGLPCNFLPTVVALSV